MASENFISILHLEENNFEDRNSILNEDSISNEDPNQADDFQFNVETEHISLEENSAEMDHNKPNENQESPSSEKSQNSPSQIPLQHENSEPNCSNENESNEEPKQSLEPSEEDVAFHLQVLSPARINETRKNDSESETGNVKIEPLTSEENTSTTNYVEQFEPVFVPVNEISAQNVQSDTYSFKKEIKEEVSSHFVEHEYETDDEECEDSDVKTEDNIQLENDLQNGDRTDAQNNFETDFPIKFENDFQNDVRNDVDTDVPIKFEDDLDINDNDEYDNFHETDDFQSEQMMFRFDGTETPSDDNATIK